MKHLCCDAAVSPTEEINNDNVSHGISLAPKLPPVPKPRKSFHEVGLESSSAEQPDCHAIELIGVWNTENYAYEPLVRREKSSMVS